MNEKQGEGTEMFCDNKSAIIMAKNTIFPSRTKHITIKYHLIINAIVYGEIQLKFCRSEDQVADIFIKALPKEKFQHFSELLDVQEHHIKGKNVVK